MVDEEVNAKFSLFKFIFGAEQDKTFLYIKGWVSKWVAIFNVILIPLFRILLIFLIVYAIVFTFGFYKSLKGGNGFIYGASQLEKQAGSPVNCVCTTPKGLLNFNSSYMSNVGFEKGNPTTPPLLSDGNNPQFTYDELKFKEDTKT